MGMIIYVEGTLIADEPFTEEQKAKIESVKNAWGYQAFGVANSTTVVFDDSQMEGSSPYEDGVIKPLEELLSYAKESGMSLDGTIEVGSDWKDYDDISIEIADNEPDYGNSEIRNATTDELVKELVKRGAEGVFATAVLDHAHCLAAQRVLMDNGIDAGETAVVMEALGAVLLNADLGENQIEYDEKRIPYADSIWEAPAGDDHDDHDDPEL